MQHQIKAHNFVLISVSINSEWRRKKSLSKVLNTFENIMENGAFANAPFSLIFKYMIFQRHYYGVKS